MDNGNHINGHLNVFWSVASIIFAWISISSVREIVSLIAGIAAIASAIFASRYYWYKTKDYLNNKK